MPAGVGYGQGLLSNPLLGASIGLLGASGPSPFPVGIGQALQGGLLGGREAAGFGLAQQGAQQRQQLDAARIQQIMDDAKLEREAIKRQEDERNAIRRLMGSSGQVPGGSQAPQGAPQAAGLLAQQGDGFRMDGGGILSPGGAAPVGQQAPTGLLGQPQQMTQQQRQLTELARITGDPKYAAAAANASRGPDSTSLQQQYEYLTRGLGKSPEEALAWLGKKGGTSVDIGGITVGADGKDTIALNKKNIGDVQQALISDQQQLGQLDSIFNSYSKDSLTWQGKFNLGKAEIKDRLNRASPAEKTALTRHTNFTQNVQRVFNNYRREITGAAAAIQELEQLKKSVINTDLSPTQFQAAFNNYRDGLLRTMRVKRSMLRSGVLVGGLTEEEYGKRFDRLWVAGTDDDIDARGDEIQGTNPGMTDAQVLDQLRQEGYKVPGSG